LTSDLAFLVHPDLTTLPQTQRKVGSSIPNFDIHHQGDSSLPATVLNGVRR